MENPLLIVEKYEEYVTYIYPCLQNIQRNNGILKERIINLTFETIEVLYKAAKSDQKSRLYEADAMLSSLRFYLRFLAKRKLISKHQLDVASIKLSEVGKILGSWILGKRGIA